MISRPSGPLHIGVSLPCLSVVWVSHPEVKLHSTPIVSRCSSSSLSGIGEMIGVGAAEARKMLLTVRANLYRDCTSEGHVSKRCVWVSSIVSPCFRQWGHHGRTGTSSSVSPRFARLCAVGSRFVHSLCANVRRC